MIFIETNFIGGLVGSGCKFFMLLAKQLKDVRKVTHLLLTLRGLQLPRRVALALLVSLSISLNAQYTNDTVHIDEVVISSVNISKFQAGAKIEKIPTKQFEVAKDGNLEQLISRYTPIGVKSMAGSFSTIRFRGTSPDHTSINFGGININSMTLGHSNISNVPMFLFDELGMQFGSSSAVNGSGSIGGAIHLGLKNYWVKGFKTEMRMAIGSFGEQLYGTKLFYGNGKFEGVTRAYWYRKENNFSFYNPTYNFESKGAYGEDVQRNASIDNKGLLQEFNFLFKSRVLFKSKIWIENNQHLIQQNMQRNVMNPDYKETYEDHHLRIWTTFENRRHRIKYNIGSGYVYDNGIHNETTNKIATHRMLADANSEYDLTSNTSFKIGVKQVHIIPDVYTYDSALHHENRTDLYFSYHQIILRKIKLTANLRKGYVTNYTVPFTPAFGLSYRVYSGRAAVLKFNANFSRSYRVPTFNDRFWGTQGKPHLPPEEGLNYELGVEYSYCYDVLSGNIKANVFYLDVENWILWKNGGSGWVPESEPKVKSKGIEIVSDFSFFLSDFEINPGFNFSYNPVVPEKTTGDTAVLGRQLEYVPLHGASVFLSANYKSLNVGIDYSYRGEQYTNQKYEDILPEVGLFNVSAGYSYKINEYNKIALRVLVNNILNIDYQSTWDFPMPRRNFRLSITYNFK
ncbi:MAG: TonB-dependent receptor plug domain-containing protein [Salinivirgaceae bacterium]|jgi:vitamin B12 transporter|nr:TonB-dependent receptor plug domain-containing protein [Salinivirgaceae bacterium]